MLHGDARHPRGPLGVGDVAGQAVRAGLLEGERDGDEATVEFGDRDLGGGVQRGQPLVAAGPLGAGGGQAQALEDGHVQAGERADVPFLVGPARPGGGGHEPARREDGHDDGVRGAQRGDQPRLAVRSDEQNTGSGWPPAAVTASASACTNPVFPATWCAR